MGFKPNKNGEQKILTVKGLNPGVSSKVGGVYDPGERSPEQDCF